MNSSGMARKVDDLGRIVLPVEMRRRLGIRAGDALDIAVGDSTIVLRKIESRCVFCDSSTAPLRSYRSRAVCGSCAGEVADAAASADGPSDDGRSRVSARS